MPEIRVRSTTTYLAVHTADEDWREVVVSWVPEEGGTVDESSMAAFFAAVDAENEKIPGSFWLLRTEHGIGLISPANFVSDYEDVAVDG